MNDNVRTAAAELDGLDVELEQLLDLLLLYDEHREGELRGVSPEKPWTIEVLLRRQNMGLSLLRSIEEKAKAAHATLLIVSTKLWEGINEGRGCEGQS